MEMAAVNMRPAHSSNAQERPSISDGRSVFVMAGLLFGFRDFGDRAATAPLGAVMTYLRIAPSSCDNRM
jgi:hypothetical protein